MLNFIFFAVALIYSVRVITYGIHVIKERNFSGGAGLFVLSLLMLMSSAMSMAKLLGAL